MTTKTISTYIAAGYTLSSSFNELIVTATGGVGGTGVTAPASASVFNYGKINASGSSIGISLLAGGSVINERGGSIGGSGGVFLSSAGDVYNDGAISGLDRDAVHLANGGTIVNGSALIPAAVITGNVEIFGDVGKVANFGTIKVGSVYLGNGGTVFNGSFYSTTAVIDTYGVEVKGGGAVFNYGRIVGGAGIMGGGAVTNGDPGDTTAEIQGVRGVEIYGAATVTNFGAISGTGPFIDGYGVVLHNGGSLTNGTVLDQTAVVQGYTGAKIFGGAGAVVNMATIRGDGVTAGNQGLYLLGGGVTNGATGDTAALIEGAGGVVLAGAGSVLNFGAIEGPVTFGALLEGGGLIINGGGSDRSALITGAYGVKIAGGAATAGNYGTIQATGSIGVGLEIDAGGLVVNGSLNNAAALIEGVIALDLSGAAGTATNFGVLAGTGDFGGEGALLNGAQTLTNGAVSHDDAVIEGFEGLATFGSGNTVTNFGTISGAAGTAVRFNAASDVLIVQAGSTFLGSVLGGGGTLDLASGTGTLSGLLSSGGDVTVSGSMAATTFQNFGTVEVGAGATFTDKGGATLAAGQSVIVAGALNLAGAVKNSGTLSVDGGTMTVKGAVTDNGQAQINGGTLDFAGTFNEAVAFTGTTGVLELADSQTYTATVSGFSKTGKTSLDLADIGFVKSTEATFSGSKTGGVLTVTDGTHTAKISLKGNYLSATFIASSDGHGGTIVVDPSAATARPAVHAFIAAMAAWSGGGAGPVYEPESESWRAGGQALARPAVRLG